MPHELSLASSVLLCEDQGQNVVYLICFLYTSQGGRQSAYKNLPVSHIFLYMCLQLSELLVKNVSLKLSGIFYKYYIETLDVFKHKQFFLICFYVIS